MKALAPIHSKHHNKLRDKRIGVMLHYFGSKTDHGAMAWINDPRFKCSYHYVVFDNGDYVQLVPLDKRAWHAGKCKPSELWPEWRAYKDANSAFYGVCAACGPHDKATDAQIDTMAHLTRQLFDREGWGHNETERVTTHQAEAWPRGRKVDPEGPPDCPAYPVFTRAQVVSRILAR